MITLNPNELKTPELHGLLLAAVAPRPICFASTIDTEGNSNVSPFSFFNIFSSNPPIAVFSPARSGRTGMTKNTLDNVKEVPEVVINIVTYEMVQQVSLASSEFPKGVDEFVKAGFSKEPSKLIKPFRVKESPVQLECKVKEVIELGTGGGAGNLVVCEIILLHIDERVMTDGKIDQKKINLVARLGANWYSKAYGDALFELVKPLNTLGIGIDCLPHKIKNSAYLSGNDLGKYGNLNALPSEEEIERMKLSENVKEILESNQDALTKEIKLVGVAKELLHEDRIKDSLAVLMC